MKPLSNLGLVQFEPYSLVAPLTHNGSSSVGLKTCCISHLNPEWVYETPRREQVAGRTKRRLEKLKELEKEVNGETEGSGEIEWIGKYEELEINSDRK